MKTRKIQIALATLFFSTLTIFLSILWHKVDKISKVEKAIAKRQNTEMFALSNISNSLNQIILELGKSAITLPEKLSSVTCSQQMGIVTSVQTIRLPTEFPAYNPSILENGENGYHLFFRYDKPIEAWNSSSFHSYIGYAELNADFSHTKLIEKVDTNSKYSEDPRALKVGNSIFLSWNDLLDSDLYTRTIHSAEWNSKKEKLSYITNLDQHIRLVEKNWIPFERSVKKEKRLGFVYGIQPHKILDIPNPQKNEIVHLCSEGDSALTKLKWKELWGSLSGGTPARLVDDEYISFFHSSFKEEEGLMWYVMGAYTFEKEFPHKIKSITPFPILFPGIYQSPLKNTADPSKRVIYPAGLAIEKRNDKTFLHVSCGENDSSMKIVTIDFDKLKKNMVSVKSKASKEKYL